MTVPGQGQEPNPQAGQEPGGSQPNAQPQTPPAAGQEPAQPPSGDTFTREYVETLRREAADFRKRATTAESKVTEHERQQLSEAERKDAEIADLKAKATDLESKYQNALIRTTIEREAMKAGAIDPDVVYALIDRGSIALDDDGSVKGAEKAVKTLLEAKPYLVGQAEGNGKATKPVPGTPKPAGAPTKDQEVDNLYQQMRGTTVAARW